MKLEDQVCSLELAKRLKELGVKQESCFLWNQMEQEDGDNFWVLFSDGPSRTNADVAAFTVAELGEIIWSFSELKQPYGISVRGIYTSLQLHGEGEDDGHTHTNVEYRVDEKTEADARAKMLIYLIENNLIDFDGLITSYPVKS